MTANVNAVIAEANLPDHLALDSPLRRYIGLNKAGARLHNRRLVAMALASGFRTLDLPRSCATNGIMRLVFGIIVLRHAITHFFDGSGADLATIRTNIQNWANREFQCCGVYVNH